MENKLTQRIGIFYKNRSWGMKVLDKIIKSIPKNEISKIRITNLGGMCYLKNGDVISCVYAGECFRGYKFTRVIMQDGIDDEIINCIIKPSITSNLEVWTDEDLDLD